MCTGLGGSFQHFLHVIVDERNLRRYAHPHGYAGSCKFAYRAQAPMRCRRPRLQDAREFAVQRGDGHVNGGKAFLRHGHEQIDIALDTAALGNYRQRVVAAVQQFDDAARDPPLALGRLVGVGHRAQDDLAGHIAA